MQAQTPWREQRGVALGLHRGRGGGELTVGGITFGAAVTARPRGKLLQAAVRVERSEDARRTLPDRNSFQSQEQTQLVRPRSRARRDAAALVGAAGRPGCSRQTKDRQAGRKTVHTDAERDMEAAPLLARLTPGSARSEAGACARGAARVARDASLAHLLGSSARLDIDHASASARRAAAMLQAAIRRRRLLIPPLLSQSPSSLLSLSSHPLLSSRSPPPRLSPAAPLSSHPAPPP